MHFFLILFTFLASVTLTVFAEAIPATPHEEYSSSVGVLGCKINTDRVAYWPMAVDCNNICVKLSYQGRSLYLLRVDQSGGAYDISYDAWNYLSTGESATVRPTAGGAVTMEYENAPMSACKSLIKTHNHKLAFSAANSMNFVDSCSHQAGSWVADNYVLYNIGDSICRLGYDEVCHLDTAVSNQASCPHQLGLYPLLTSAPVYNIKYPTGEKYIAGTGTTVAVGRAAKNTADDTGRWQESDHSASVKTSSESATSESTASHSTASHSTASHSKASQSTLPKSTIFKSTTPKSTPKADTPRPDGPAVAHRKAGATSVPVANAARRQTSPFWRW